MLLLEAWPFPQELSEWKGRYLLVSASVSSFVQWKLCCILPHWGVVRVQGSNADGELGTALQPEGSQHLPLDAAAPLSGGQ